MYPLGPMYDDIVSGRNRRIAWHGSITLQNGTHLDFTNENIKENTGSLTKRANDGTKIDIGNVYASLFTARFKDLNVSRYELYNAIIDELAVTIIFYQSFGTWADALNFTWGQVSTAKWGDEYPEIHVEIPMGQYIIKEAMQTSDGIKITAYDFMIKFDVPLPSKIDKNAKSPYAWIETACEACGVTLGTSRQDLYYMPNGLRAVKFANTNSNVKTWRDLLAEITTVLCANATINRAGELEIKRYKSLAVDTIMSSGRYTGEFSDFQSYYTGIYLDYKEKNIKDYQTNADSAEEDTGLTLDIGANSFMQIEDDTTRREMLKEIIDALKGLLFTPFSVSAPFNPCYDLIDTLTFDGNQADPSRDIAPITSIVWRIGGKMDIACGGEDPTLQEAKSHESKAIDSIDSGGGAWENMWMVMGMAPEQNLVIQQNQAATKVGEVMFYARDAKSMFQVSYTVNFILDEAALIEITLFADNERIIKAEQNCFNGENVITVTSGQEVDGEGSHTVNAFIRVLPHTLDITDLLPSATGEVF